MRYTYPRFTVFLAEAASPDEARQPQDPQKAVPPPRRPGIR